MPVGVTLFVFLFFFLPGLFFIQSTFLFQRVSVEYADTLVEKGALAILFAPLIHAASISFFWLIHHLLNTVFFLPAAFRIESNPSEIFSAYSEIAGVLFGNADANGVLSLNSKLSALLIYQSTTVVIAFLLSAIVSSIAINFFRGLPGLREGVYGLTNGFLRRNLFASVMCRDPQHEGKAVIYSGLVRKLRVSRAGQVQHIFLQLPQKRVAAFRSRGNTMGLRSSKFSGIENEEYSTGKVSLIDSKTIRKDIEKYKNTILGMSVFRPPLMFVDGADIVNIYFYPLLYPQSRENKTRIKIAKFYNALNPFLNDPPLVDDEERKDSGNERG